MRHGIYRIETKDEFGNWRPMLQWSWEYTWVMGAIRHLMGYNRANGINAQYRLVDHMTGEVVLQVAAISPEQRVSDDCSGG